MYIRFDTSVIFWAVAFAQRKLEHPVAVIVPRYKLKAVPSSTAPGDIVKQVR